MMNQILSDIAKKIIASKENDIGQGLMHGNAGLALFFYLLAKNTET